MILVGWDFTGYYDVGNLVIYSFLIYIYFPDDNPQWIFYSFIRIHARFADIVINLKRRLRPEKLATMDWLLWKWTLWNEKLQKICVCGFWYVYPLRYISHRTEENPTGLSFLFYWSSFYIDIYILILSSQYFLLK